MVRIDENQGKDLPKKKSAVLTALFINVWANLLELVNAY